MNNENNIKDFNEFVSAYKRLKEEIGKTIVGQDKVIEDVLIAIFSKGHGLLVGVPGLAKTLLVSTIAKALNLTFNRIQFTPDLMPSDIVGAEILDKNRDFTLVKGPLFSNIILADEINRTPPKTQSALLEAMQEKSITIGTTTHKLEEPFFVLATQNPIEQEGTYPLPEAQLDRFMFNIVLDYPSFDEEVEIIKRTTMSEMSEPNIILSKEDIIKYQNIVRMIPVPDNVYRYAVNIAAQTRPFTNHAPEIVNTYLSWGAGPRASQYLILGAKCHAAINGKFSPDFEDVNAVAKSILRHRIVKNYKAEAEGISQDYIVDQLLEK
ncbi:MoxR family ATPase [Bacteroidales bacterium OttesenSCG-928-K03]|nr:MoxR family ATPase [Bacteroidales bacterium OttesenSCG-928-K22]MDL2243185.1 MoxR family ATPase [Bacteroidales bacterium OttesenSCG-928-K03]